MSFDVTRVQKIDASSAVVEEVTCETFLARLQLTPTDQVNSKLADIDYDEGTMVMALGPDGERFRVTVGSLKQPGRRVSQVDLELEARGARSV